MNKLETIESLVQKIPCPLCLNSRFEVNLSCGVSHSACDFQAVCGHCHYKFIVTEDYADKKDILKLVKDSFEKNGCPECKSKDLDIEFLCDLGSEDCFFLVKCRENNHFSRIDQRGIRYLFS